MHLNYDLEISYSTRIRVMMLWNYKGLDDDTRLFTARLRRHHGCCNCERWFR